MQRTHCVIVIILNASLAAIMPDVLIVIAYAFLTMTIAIPLFEKAMRLCKLGARQ
jgi:hypothetical protein